MKKNHQQKHSFSTTSVEKNTKFEEFQQIFVYLQNQLQKLHISKNQLRHENALAKKVCIYAAN